MLGALAIAYLFAGGAAAGCIAMCCALDLFAVRQPFGCRDYTQGPSLDPAARTLDYAFAAGLGLLVFGMVALVADVGRFDRVLTIFTAPGPSMMAFGAYAIAALFAVAAFLAAVRLLYLPAVPALAVRIAEAVAIPIALAVMAYTGLLLMSVEVVALWRSAALPFLFVFASLSSGAAALLLCICAAASSPAPGAARIQRVLMRADTAFIAAELASAALFLAGAWAGDDPAASASLRLLADPAAYQAQLWWLGFAGCGVLIPAAVELVAAFRKGVDQVALRKAACIAGLLVLAGSLCLRWAVVDAGTYVNLDLAGVAAPALEQGGIGL